MAFRGFRTHKQSLYPVVLNECSIMCYSLHPLTVQLSVILYIVCLIAFSEGHRDSSICVYPSICTSVYQKYLRLSINFWWLCRIWNYRVFFGSLNSSETITQCPLDAIKEHAHPPGRSVKIDTIIIMLMFFMTLFCLCFYDIVLIYV